MSNRAPSASTSLFHESAEHLAVRLDQESSPEARELAAEARALAALFIAWQTSRPADSDRIAGIQQLFDVNRRAMDLLAR